MKKLLLVLLSCLVSNVFAVTEHYNLAENIYKNYPFSEAVRVQNTVYLSGQIGIIPGQTELVKGGIKAETKQIFHNIGLVLKHFSLDYQHITKCMVMLNDISDFAAFNQVYRSFFTFPYPARSTFAVKDLALGAKIEIECIAHLPNNKAL